MAENRMRRRERNGGTAARDTAKMGRDNSVSQDGQSTARLDMASQTAAAKQPAAGIAGESASPAVQPREVVVHIEVICGGITHVKVPVAVGPRYQGMPLAGPAKAFDRLLDCWLTRALELGMIGSGLGQLFPVNVEKRREAGKINIDCLLMVGMGDPGHFAADDLRYLMSNVTVAVKSMGHKEMSTMLIGTRRNELHVDQAARNFLQGILDGYERFRAIAEAVTERKEHFQEAAEQKLMISLVEADEEKAKQIFDAFNAICRERTIPQMTLEVSRGTPVLEDPEPEQSAADTDPNMPVTLLRITRSPIFQPSGLVANPTPVATGTEVFQYSALSEVAAVTVREVEVNSYIVRELPDRMAGPLPMEEREDFCEFFTNYLIPDEFRKLTENGENLTLIVDETTATYPWEMAAHKKYSRTSFLGTSLGLSRRFHTLLSPPPGSLPPLNRALSVLVIADPAPRPMSLPHARREGLTVVDVLAQAQSAWKGDYQFKVTVRLGSHQEPDDPVLEQLRGLRGLVECAASCDPLELVRLIVNEQFDVIHFAGHGAFDRTAGRAGWVFDRDCFLSAQEIFRVRQVPRLVFANACFSAVTVNQNEQHRPLTFREQRGQLIGLAQAFFARGIPNYVGTGWQVDDACAELVARWFYTRVLGLRRPADSPDVIGTSPPATIGDALLVARQQALAADHESATWGAYQHYGRVCDKLLAIPNVAPQRQEP